MGRYRKDNSKRLFLFYKETISPLKMEQSSSEEGSHDLVLAFLKALKIDISNLQQYKIQQSSIYSLEMTRLRPTTHIHKKERKPRNKNNKGFRIT